jgi:hypothetical protein
MKDKSDFFRGILRLEDLLVFVSMVILYQKMEDASWKQFLSLFFLPDISLMGYVFGKKIGAIFYGLGLNHFLFLILIWVAHIGFDRALGFGLKHSLGFEYTHLGVIKLFKNKQ